MGAALSAFAAHPRPTNDAGHPAILTLQQERTLAMQSDNFSGCAISPDGALIATSSSSYQTAHVVDISTGAIAYTIQHDENVNDVAWTSDGRRLFAVCASGVVFEATRPRNPREPWTHRVCYTHAAGVNGCAVSAQGIVALACDDGHIVLLDSGGAEAKFVQHIQLVGVQWCVAFSPDSSLLAAMTARSKVVCIFRRSPKGKYEKESTGSFHTKDIVSMRFSADGRRLIAGSHDTTASIWTMAGEAEQAERTIRPTVVLKGHSSYVYGVAFSGDGAFAMTASFDKAVRVWRVADGKQLDVFETADIAGALSFHAASGLLAAGVDGHGIEIWRCARA